MTDLGSQMANDIYINPDVNTPETADASQSDRLMKFAQTAGDISEHLSSEELSSLGQKVVEDYERDDSSRSEWKTIVENALKYASQEPVPPKNYPWPSASNFQYPILTVASQQFAARAMPAIVKGDEAVGMKVLGDAPKAPELPPPPQPLPPDAPPEAQQQQQAMIQQVQAMTTAYGQRHEQWEAKQARAKRVKTYLNYKLFYGMENWEEDTDALLNQIPIIGIGFRKVYYNADTKSTCSEYVSALHLTVDMETKDLQTCPRITQDFTLYPYEVRAKQKAGIYRDVDLADDDSDDTEHPRCILEQHRLHDLDDDGIAEPYIITVDKESRAVLRIEAAYGEDDLVYGIGSDNNSAVPVEADPQVAGSPEGAAVNGGTAQPNATAERTLLSIRRWVPFIKYPFLPDPKGRFYAIGFGHLLAPLTSVINTTINELIDAGNAQNAGGGFIASGLRLQGSGQSSSVLRFTAGEYKVVNSSGPDIRSQIWERTLPQVSPVLFNLLDLMIGAAKEISSVKDVLTGEASNTAPVGTTLALIDQSLAGYTAIYKRIWRSLKQEFELIYECEGRYGGQYGEADEYGEIVDDPEADFEKDFSPKGHDIVPVSDPSVVTKQQAVAKGQMLIQLAESPLGMAAGFDPRKVIEAVLEPAEIEVSGLFQEKPQPNPAAEAEVKLKLAQAENQSAQAKLALANAGKSDAEAKSVLPKAVSEMQKNNSAADQHAAAGMSHIVNSAIAVESHPHTVAMLQAQAAKHAADAHMTMNPPEETENEPA